MITWQLIDELDQAYAMRNREVLLEVGGMTWPIERVRAYEHNGKVVCVLHAGVLPDIVPPTVTPS